MKVALISDVHGNLEALEAVLADIQKQGADRIFCLGDIVGYGPNPRECVALVREHCDVVVRGNHEVGLLDDFYTQAHMGPTANEVILWTRGQFVDDELLAFISELPYTEIVQTEPSERRILLAHAQFFEPEEFSYLAVHDENDPCPSYIEQLDRMSTGDRLFIGHHHYAYFLHYADQEPQISPEEDYDLQGNSAIIILVGAVGQSRIPEMKDAQYALYDAQKDRLAFYHVPYDYETTVGKIERCGFSKGTQKELMKLLSPEM